MSWLSRALWSLTVQRIYFFRISSSQYERSIVHFSAPDTPGGFCYLLPFKHILSWLSQSDNNVHQTFHFLWRLQKFNRCKSHLNMLDTNLGFRFYIISISMYCVRDYLLSQLLIFLHSSIYLTWLLQCDQT